MSTVSLNSRAANALAILLGSLVIIVATGVRAQSPGGGQVLVVTDPPGATVFVDGRASGTAPVTVADLIPGAHIVVATSLDGARVEQVVEVEAGRSTLVQLALAATPPPPPTETTQPPGAESDGPPAPATAEPPPPSSPPAAPLPTSASAGPTAPTELVESDLSASQPSAGAEHAEQVVREPIGATGFPGLIGPTLGFHLDVPVYVLRPATAVLDRRTGRPVQDTSAIAIARMTLEWGVSAFTRLIGAADVSNGAVGIGVGLGVPTWIPLSRGVALALQPSLSGIAYIAPGDGVFLSGEVDLRLGFAPAPHLVLSLDFGFDVLGAIPFDNSTVVGGVYLGPVFGGGIEWAFY